MNKNKMTILVAIIMVIMLYPKNAWAESDSEKCEKELDLKISEQRNYTSAAPNIKITISANKKATIKYRIIKVGDSTEMDDSDVDKLFKEERYGNTNYRKLAYSLTDEISGKSDTHTINLAKKPKAIYVFAELAKPYSFKSGKDTIKCRAGKIALKETTNGGYNIKIINKNDYTENGTGSFAFYTIPGKTDAENNTMYGTKACDEFRNGQHKDLDKNVDEKYKIGNPSEWVKRASAYFPYCFDNSAVKIRFSQAKIRKIKNQFIEVFNGIKKIQDLDKSEENKEYDEQLKYVQDQSNGFNYVETQNGNKDDDSQYLTNAGTLQCDDNQTEHEDKKFYSSENEILKNDLCNVKCYETFVTTYDPPVTSSSGLCFSYKVTVRSKVYCKTEINKDKLKWPTGVAVCASMGAECNGNKSETQAGPSEAFDSCIKSCDGGKYSQKCIDKCYNKVYKTNEDKEISTEYNKLSYNDSKNTKLDSLVLYNDKENKTSLTNVKFAKNHKNDEDWCEKEEDKDPYHYQWDDNHCIDVKESCATRDDIKNNGDKCAEYFYKAKNQEPYGSYKGEENHYVWDVGDAPKYDDNAKDGYKDEGANGNRTGAGSVFNSVKRAAKYYMRSVAQTKSLLRSFYALDGSRNGAGGLRYYNIDNNGIKRQFATGWHCHEVCRFYPTSGGSVGGNGCVSSVKEAEKYYEDQIKLNNGQVEACENAAKANCAEKTSTFEIGANNQSKTIKERGYNAEDNRLKNTNDTSKNEENKNVEQGKNTKNDIFRSIESYKDYYSGEKEQSDGKGATNCVNGICYDSKEEDGSISNGINGICYGNKYPYHDYKTTITFPGACINDKSGNITDDPTKCDVHGSVNGEYGTLFADQYCLLYNSEPYNSRWWYYKAWGAERYQKKYQKVYEKSDETRDYNIKSHIEKFGKFNWSVETQCFYGTEDSTAPIDDYVYKVIKVGEAFTKYQKDKIPFNFTKEAKINTIPSDTTDANAKTYSINPEKYVEYINTTEKELFETPEFASSECPGCDYHIKLSGDQLLEIRKYYTSEKKRDYTEYNGTFTKDKTIEGLVHYTSDVIDYLRDHYKLKRNENSLNKNNNYYNSSVDLYATNK